MGRPYGVGFYGTHRYSRGSYVRLASVAQAAAEAQANAVRVRGAWAEAAPAAGAAYAVQPDTLADRATFLSGGVSAVAGAGITLDRAPTAVRASSRSWAGLDRIRTFRAGARAVAASLAQSETTLGPAALLNAVGVGYAVQPDTLADRAAFSETQALSGALPGKLALSLVYEVARATATSQAEVDFFSAARLSAQATAYTSGRFAWEPGDVTDTGVWDPQAVPGAVWVRQDPPPTEWN